MSLRVFISSTTDKKAARERSPDPLRTWIANELHKSNTHCDYQEFQIEQGVNTLVKLAQSIEQSEVVVHVLVDEIGSVPPPDVVRELLRHCGEDRFRSRFSILFERNLALDCELWQRLTYTQWEAWLGKFYEKDVLLCHAADAGDGRPATYPGEDDLALGRAEHIRLLKPYAGYPIEFADREELRDLIQKALLRKLQSAMLTVDSPVWPNSPAPRQSCLADRQPELQLFLDLISPECSERVLLIHGPSNLGKSSLLKEFRRQAAVLPPVVCGCADFKGGAPLRNMLDKLAEDLAAVARFARYENEVRKVDKSARYTAFLEDLSRITNPVLLLLDTYEEATDECRIWFEDWLLPLIRRSESVRVVITGHCVPETPHHWHGLSYNHELRPITKPVHWCQYRDLLGVKNISDDEVSAMVAACNGNPSVVSALLANRKVRI